MKKEDYPQDWREALEEIIGDGRISVVLGAPDTGKSTFVLFLAQEALARGKKVGIVDADMGQSDIGPPSTIGLGFAEKNLGSLSESSLEGLYFVGSFSPERNLLPAVVGTKKMVDQGLALGAQILIVDTTGLVRNEIGRILKESKIELIDPQQLILLQRKREIEHLALPFYERKDIKIHRLSVPSRVKRRSPEARRKYRQERLEAYFEKNSSFALPLEESLLGRSFSTFSLAKESFVNLLVGLEDEKGEMLALGVIKNIDFAEGKIVLLSPWPEPRKIKRLLLSDIQLELSSLSFSNVSRRESEVHC